MKINRVKPSEEKKISGKDSIILNIYYFLEFYKFIFLLILGIAFTVFAVLAVLDLTIPDTLQDIDKKTTLKAFENLRESGRHQDAITLMEYKGKILEGSNDEIVAKLELADSYIHVGDYSKAEKMYFDVWNTCKKQPDYHTLESFVTFGIARELYHLYENMGDSINQIRYFNLFYTAYSKGHKQIESTIYKAENNGWLGKNVRLNIKEIIEYDSIKISYYHDERKAVKRLSEYIDKIYTKEEYSPSYKIKCLNKLISWQMKSGNITDTYSRIYQAVSLAQKINFVNEYAELGNLSDYCYQVHDLKTSKVLFRKYQRYLAQEYGKDDFEYIKNQSRSFRYLEADKDWDNLIEKLDEYCNGMRVKIAQNIPSMTSAQREFYAKQFDVAYNYSLHVLQEHPNDDITGICFDNNTFRRGLLLRSNLSIKNSIDALHDRKITAMYDSLIILHREEIYQSVSGRKILKSEPQSDIEDRIDEFEKQIALKCTDFKTKNQILDEGYSKIQKSLRKGDAIVNLMEHEGKLFALVLKHTGHVSYVPIGTREALEQKLHRPISDIYHDKYLTEFIWGKVSQKTADVNRVFYLPSGIFSQINLGILYSGDDQYLCDNTDFYLLSNNTDIIDLQPLHITQNSKDITLWGGIDYGNMTANTNSRKVRGAIKRGESLSFLNFAFQEVSDISRLLKSHRINNILYTSNHASETAFKKRSGKQDYIIHVSTHGFFNERNENGNPMTNSGLFFAGANKYWCSDTLKIAYNGNDGILMSAEIEDLNLSGCQLVVLSACETGLGYSNSSEGVYGLQRAFKLAGARQIVMSLWDVDDHATTLLMKSFYQNLLNGYSTDAALEKAQNVVREQYPSPENWGAFVLLH